MISLSIIKNRLVLLFCFFAFLSSQNTQAQDAYRGKDFWIGFPRNNDNQANLVLYLTSTVNAVATVEIPGATPFWSQVVVIPANGIIPLNLPLNIGGGLGLGNPANNAVSNLGIHITSPDFISVYGSSENATTMEAFLSIPTANLGTSYITMSPEGITSAPASFMVVATENNTSVTFTLPAGKAAVGRGAGSTWTVNLNQGQVYFNQNTGVAGLNGDLTGTQIQSNKPVSVLSGGGCVNFPGSASTNGYATCSYCDFIVEQLTPVSTWGKSFVAAEFIAPDLTSFQDNSFIRVVTSDPGTTTIDITGYPQQTLTGVGAYKDFKITGGVAVTSDFPIALYGLTSGNQCYSGLVLAEPGDPSYVAIIPEEQWGRTSPFICMDGANNNFDALVNIVSNDPNPNVDIDGVMYNNFTPIGATGFYYKHVAVSNATHLATSATHDFMVYVYGWDTDVSYAYPAAGPTLKKLDIAVNAGFVNDTVCQGDVTTFTDTSTTLNTIIIDWEWDFDDGNTSSTQHPTHTFSTDGTFNVQLIATDTSGIKDTVVVPVIVNANPAITLSAADTICNGESAQLTAAGGDVYTWSGTGLSANNIPNPIATPTSTITYNITVENSTTGCTSDTTLELVVNPLPVPVITGTTTICEGFSETFSANNADSYLWKPTLETTQNITYTPSQSGVLRLILTEEGCVDSTDVNITVEPKPEAGVGTGAEYCNTDQQVNLNASVTGGDLGGAWSVESGGGTIDPVSGIWNPKNVSEGIYDVYYVVSGQQACPADSAILPMQVWEVPVSVAGVISPICVGDIAKVPVSITGSNTPFTVTIMENGTPVVFNNIQANDTLDLPVVPNKTYTWVKTESSGTTVCTENLNIPLSIVFQTPPTIQVDSLVCDATNSNYVVHVSFTDGDINSYIVNSSIDNSGQATYVSSPIVSGGNYEFWISDQYACSPVDSVKGVFSCGCSSLAGTMDMSLPLDHCVNNQVVAIHNGDESKDGNDVLSFVLHDNAGSTLGTIIQHNATPVFSFDPATMSTETTYYISAVVGDELSGGKVDLSNPNGCMSVSVGVPVVFHELPDVTFTPSVIQGCVGDSAVWVTNYPKGSPSFQVKDQFSTILLNSSGYIDTLKIQLTGDTTVLIHDVTDQYGCVSLYNPEQQLNATVFEEVAVSNINATCNGTNTAYTLEFDINDGDVATYNVVGSSTGAIAGTHYTSSEIPNGANYTLNVTDGNGCDTVVVTGNHFCACGTVSGEMQNGSNTTVSEVCVENVFSPAIADVDMNNIADGYTPDANDTLSYIILANMADTNLSVPPFIAISSVPQFAFTDGAMVTGTTYYVVPVAGDVDPATNLVDFNVGCRDYGDGSPFMWVQPATITTQGPLEICQGDVLQLQATVTSINSIHFQMASDYGFSTDTILPVGANTISVSMNTPGVAQFYIDTLGAAITDITSPNACKAYWLGDTVTVNVEPIPTASFNAPFNLTICNGESIDLPLTTTGSHQITAVTDNAGNHTNVAGIYSNAFNVSPVAGTAYNLTGVSSQTPTGLVCAGTILNPSITIGVNALPNVSVGFVPDEICLGDLTEMKLSVTGDNPEYYVYYHSDQGHNSTEVSSSGQFTNTPFALNTSTTFTIDSVADATVSDATNKACVVYPNSSETVMVNPLPTASISNTGKMEICDGDEAEYSISLTGMSPFTIDVEDVLSGSITTQTVTSNPYVFNFTPSDTVEHRVIKVVDGNGCEAIDMKGVARVNVNSLPDVSFVADKKDSCLPFVVHLQNITSPEFFGQCEWQIGNEPPISSCGDIIHQFSMAGSYTISLRVESDKGCISTFTESDFDAHPIPVADFSYNPSEPTVLESNIQFVNETSNASIFNWTFDTLQTSSQTSPIIAFPHTQAGQYEVKLVARSIYNCVDSTSQIIEVIDVPSVYLPNAFTPEGDGVNDIYYPVLRGVKKEGYTFQVFDRWGELIFSTHDLQEGWDGYYLGELSKQDVYTVVVKAVQIDSAKKIHETGRVTLLR